MKSRDSVLAILNGALVLTEVKSGGPGKCPLCGSIEFRNGGWYGKGWIECCNDECDFQVLSSHVKEMESQSIDISRITHHV